MNYFKNILLLVLINTAISFSQTYIVEKVSGNVKLLNAEDKWINIKEGINLTDNSLIVTEKNSSVKISAEGVTITFNELSAVQTSNIKKMTINELLLALAMEDIISAPRKKENNNGKTTAVYGTKEAAVEKGILSDGFGIKRINGAVQLAENGFKESAVVAAKEIFRKYPATKKKAGYRIYFANLLYDFGLYEEAYNDFNSIKELTLSEEEKEEVEKKISLINTKLVNKQ